MYMGISRMAQLINACGHPERKPCAKGMCASCYQSDYARRWRKANPEKARAKQARYRSRNRERLLAYERSQASKRKQAREKLIRIVIDYYGGKCACCGESERIFLTIDHINDDGAEQKRQIGSRLYRWLRQNNFPAGFQVLCWNCNSGRARNGGICPHKSC